MSVRGIWIVNTSNGSLLYSRRFRTCERRAKLLADSSYRGLPKTDEEWARTVLVQWERITHGKEIAPCDRSETAPVLEVSSGVWPIVVYHYANYLFICLPVVDLAVEELSVKPVPKQKLPSITTGLCLLKELGVLIKAASQHGIEACQLEIQQYVSFACPFGTIAVVDPSVPMGLTDAKPIANMTGKQPAWRQLVPASKSRNNVTLRVNEYVRAVQYDVNSTPDICEIYGSVRCKADVEGIPEITIGIQSDNGIESLTTHSCVQSLEPPGHSTGTVSHMHKIRFVPPTNQFEVCGYKMCASQIRLPIRGFFQMKSTSASSVKLLIQLKLDERLPKTFDFCEVKLPLYSRGPISSVDSMQKVATMSISSNRREITWIFGQKWPSREIAIPASITFGGSDNYSGPNTSEENDGFYVGENACLEIKFKLPDATMSATSVNPNNFMCSQGPNVTVHTASQIMSSSYKIWNSLGKSRQCLPAEQLLS